MAKIYLTNNQKFQGIENLEVFKIKHLPSNIDLQKYDALIFTSKNAIFSINSFNKDWKNINSYCIGEKTSQIVLENGGRVFFASNGSSGNKFAKQLISLLKNKKNLYVRAQKVVSNLAEILKSNNIDIDELIAYKIVCNNININIENNSTIIFTSPSSITCFLKNFQWNKTLKAIVIGKTTAKYLPNNIKYKTSSKTSVEECINLAREFDFNV